MNVRYYAKEDPWTDWDGQNGRPVLLARLGDGPGTEAIWNGIRGAWEPFPALWERLIGGDWWEAIHEERARRHFDAEAFAGGEIQQPLPEAEMDRLIAAFQARRQEQEQPIA